MPQHLTFACHGCKTDNDSDLSPILTKRSQTLTLPFSCSFPTLRCHAPWPDLCSLQTRFHICRKISFYSFLHRSFEFCPMTQCRFIIYQYVREWLTPPSFVLRGININQSCNSQVLGDSIDCYRFYHYYTLSDQMYASAFSSVIEMTLVETEQQLNYELYVVYVHIIYYCLI